MSHLDRPHATTKRELRKFAFLVGGAFLVLAAGAFWRHKPAVTVRVFGGLGGTLALAGAVIPGALGPIYDGWMRLALVISKVTTPIFMAVIYYIVLTPTGWLMRMFGWKGLRHGDRDTAWFTRPADERASALDRQF